MSTWIFFALLAPATYAAINFIDKYLIESKVKDYRGMPIYSAIAGMLFGTVIWFLYGFPILPFFQGFLVILTGVLSVTALTLYFKALAGEQTSIIMILFQLAPIFSLTLSFFLLGETIDLNQLLGFGLILFAAIGASVKFTNNKFKVTSALWLIICTDFMWALANVLFKFVSFDHPFSALLVYEGWGFGLGGILLWYLYPAARIAFLKNFNQVGKSVMAVIFLNEGFFVIARLITYFALTIVSVALVTVVGSTQIFFGLLYGLILTWFFPKIFKEETDIKSLTKKLLFGVLAVLGIYFVN